MDWKKKIAAVDFLLSHVCVPVAAILLPEQAVSKTETCEETDIYSGCFLGWNVYGAVGNVFFRAVSGAGLIAHSESGDGDGTFGKNGYQWLF